MNDLHVGVVVVEMWQHAALSKFRGRAQCYPRNVISTAELAEGDLAPLIGSGQDLKMGPDRVW